MTFQITRDPQQNASSEWSDYVKVHGVTTIPMASTPPVTKGVSIAPPGLSSMGLLLLIIFLSVAVIVVVAMVTSAIVVVKCLRK